MNDWMICMCLYFNIAFPISSFNFGIQCSYMDTNLGYNVLHCGLNYSHLTGSFGHLSFFYQFVLVFWSDQSSVSFLLNWKWTDILNIKSENILYLPLSNLPSSAALTPIGVTKIFSKPQTLLPLLSNSKTLCLANVPVDKAN